MIKKVLIVDDNPTNLYMLETLLRGYGLEVTSAENGKDALDKARRFPPDLVITDILMPVMDGYTLCREWKSDTSLKHIPIVFYTATYTEPKDEEFALSLGVDRFIVKPQEPEVFMDMLKEVLGGKYAARQAERPLGEEMEFFRRHNEILFNKLEKKMLDLEIANKRLKLSDECYRLSFQNVSDVIYTMDRDLTIISMSPSVEKILGYKPQDFIGRSVMDFRHIMSPESYERATIRLSLVLKGNTVPAEVYEFISKDGSRKFGEVSVSSIMRNGEVIGVVSVARDITDRRRAEEALRESERKYRELYDFLPIPVYEMDLESNIISANRAIYALFGGSEEDTKKGFKAWQLLSGEEIEKSKKNIERLLKGERLGGTEYNLKRLDGSVFSAIVISDVIYSKGEPVGLRGAIIDITERKRVEQELRSAYQKSKELEFIINHSPVIAWLWKAAPGWPVDYVSENVVIYGYAPDDFTTGRIAYSSIVHPDDLARVAEEVERYTREGRTEYTQLYRIFTKSGEVRWLDDRTWVRRGEDGSVTHYQGISVDITERKRVEAELEASRNMLIRAEKLAAIGQLSAGVAHEILNPVNIMGMRLQMLGMTETLSEKTKEAIRICEEQIKRITRIAKDLQQFSRVSERQIAPTDICELIERVLNLMRPRLKVENVRVDTRYKTDLPLVPADRDRMGQVILNLINNALDAMKDRPERTLRVVTELAEQNMVRLSFSDTGAGISDEVLPKIFDPFFTTKEAGEGTGLGLSISYGIIQDHGGKIWAENNEKGGATFVIELPIEVNGKQ